MTTLVGYAVVSHPGGTTSATVVPDSSLQPGMWMLLTYMGAASITPATPAGFQPLAAQASFGTRTAAVWGGFRGAGDTSYTINYASTVNGMQAVLMWGGGAVPDISSWIAGTGETRAQTGTTFDNIAPSITSVSDHTLSLALSFEATTASESNVSSITGATPWFFAPAADSSQQIHTLSASYIDKSPAGPTGDVTIVYPNTQANNGWAIQIGIPSGSQSSSGSGNFSAAGQLDATGSPSWAGTAALTASGSLTGRAATTFSGDADLSSVGVLNPTASLAASGSVSFSSQGRLSTTSLMHANVVATLSSSGALSGDTATPVERWILSTPMYVAHRNAELDWPEETLYGYQQAAQWSRTQALEISVQRSSDGVWVASHDQTTGRVFSGTSLDIPSNTWATLSTKTTIIGSKPIARLVDILSAYPTRILWVDNKNTTNITEFLNLLDANGGPSRIIVKGYAGSTAYSDAARTRGYKTWGFFYDTDTPNISTWAPHWDLLGEDYSSTSASWSAIMAQGKPVLAHTVDTAAHRDLATSYGATGFMASSDIQVVPQSPEAAILSVSGTLQATGSLADEAPFSVMGSLSAVGSPSWAGPAEFSLVGELLATSSVTQALSGSLALSTEGVLSAEGLIRSFGVAELSGSFFLTSASSPVATAPKVTTRLLSDSWSGSLTKDRWTGSLL